MGGPRLLTEMKAYITGSNLSYSKIINEIKLRWGRVVSKSTISYYRKSHQRLKDIYLKNLSEHEKGYLIGFYTGDGSLEITKRDSYITKFDLNSLTEKHIAMHLVYLLTKIGLNPYIKKEKNKNMIRVCVCSKLFQEYIKSNVVYYQDYNNKVRTKRKMLLCPKKFNHDFRLGFIAGMIDSDGYIIKKYQRVSISTSSSILAEQVFCIIKKLRFKVSKYSTKRKKGATEYRLRIFTTPNEFKAKIKCFK